MHRASFETPIRLVSTLLGIAIAWQAVRFCQGHAQVPGLVEPQLNTLSSLSIMLQLPFYYLMGIGFWLSAAVLTMICGQMVGRYVAVGGKQLVEELRESWAEEQRLATIEANRTKRRELRRRQRAEKSGGDTAGAFIVGAIFGAFFF